MWKKLAVLAFVVASPTLAHAMPQTQDEWYVDSGRYINGHVPSYDQGYYQAPSRNLYLATREARRNARVIERRTSGYFYSQGYFTSDREAMVRALGA